MTLLQAATRRDVGIAPYTVIASPIALRILMRIRAKQSSGICKGLDNTLCWLGPWFTRLTATGWFSCSPEPGRMLTFTGS